MMLNIIVLFNRLVNLIKRLEDKNIYSPSDHCAYTILPVTCRVRYVWYGIFEVFATSRPVGLADPEIERFASLGLLDMVKRLCLRLERYS